MVYDLCIKLFKCWAFIIYILLSIISSEFFCFFSCMAFDIGPKKEKKISSLREKKKKKKKKKG